MAQSKNVVLIGFMGVGKTTIGRNLSQRIGYKHIDTDFEIEKTVSLSVEQIFDNYGESYFRELEEKIVNKYINYENIVISTGGGIVLNKKNVDNLKRIGKIIFLYASFETILKNVSNPSRPLLKGYNKSDRLKELLNLRKENYECYDIKICVDNKSIDEIVDAIIFELKENNL